MGTSFMISVQPQTFPGEISWAGRHFLLSTFKISRDCIFFISSLYGLQTWILPNYLFKTEEEPPLTTQWLLLKDISKYYIMELREISGRFRKHKELLKCASEKNLLFIWHAYKLNCVCLLKRILQRQCDTYWTMFTMLVIFA